MRRGGVVRSGAWWVYTLALGPLIFAGGFTEIRA
jgi:hypothetical protein